MNDHRNWCDTFLGGKCDCPYGLTNGTFGGYAQPRSDAKKKGLKITQDKGDNGTITVPPSTVNRECVGDRWQMTIEPFYGTRSWNLDKYGRLVSPQRNFLWKPGVNEAGGKIEYGHGFYSYTDEPTWDGKVKGIVKCTGRVTAGTRGLVSEKAEIVAYYEPKPKKGNLVQRLQAKAALALRVADAAPRGKGGYRMGLDFAVFLLSISLMIGSATTMAMIAAGWWTILLAVSIPVWWFTGSLFFINYKYCEKALGLVKDNSLPPLDEMYGIQKFHSIEEMLKAFPVYHPKPVVPSYKDEGFWDLR